MDALYKVGDKIKIIKNGHLSWRNDLIDRKKMRQVDIMPRLVGQEGIVTKIDLLHFRPFYVLSGINGKDRWYTEDQMQLITRNTNPN